jgi:hypothetical protein
MVSPTSKSQNKSCSNIPKEENDETDCSSIRSSSAIVFAHGNEKHVMGTVTSISENSITVETTSKKTVTVTVSSTTKSVCQIGARCFPHLLPTQPQFSGTHHRVTNYEHLRPHASLAARDALICRVDHTRRHARFGLEVDVTVRSKKLGLIPGTAIDVSESGMSTVLPVELPVGEICGIAHQSAAWINLPASCRAKQKRLSAWVRVH